MANKEHLEILNKGTKDWNKWREQNPLIKPDLSFIRHTKNLGFIEYFKKRTKLRSKLIGVKQLSGPKLEFINFKGTNLSGADLRGANLRKANFEKANLSEASLIETHLYNVNAPNANLNGADIRRANLIKAVFTNSSMVGTDLYRANLWKAQLDLIDFSKADLSSSNLNSCTLVNAKLIETNLRYARLVDSNLSGATLDGCFIYGSSIWNINLNGTSQSNLIVTRPEELTVTVDNLEVAQFIYLLLNNKKIREVIDTMTSKVVLILGRFSFERKIILDEIKNELRRNNYLPILFDFDKPSSRDLTETVSTLAHMARFIIADITDAKSIPHELMRIIPSLPSVPVQPLILSSEEKYSMFEHFRQFPWVSEPLVYSNADELLSKLKEKLLLLVKLKG